MAEILAQTSVLALKNQQRGFLDVYNDHITRRVGCSSDIPNMFDCAGRDRSYVGSGFLIRKSANWCHRNYGERGIFKRRAASNSIRRHHNVLIWRLANRLLLGSGLQCVESDIAIAGSIREIC